ncbi:hypothetical protein [Fictibacillus macauensis]|uniref:hypothetical protein n=1 Tax=Fictibacillus macauensis TaxID=245160 RepID=UPI000302E071|nr:hypothetical protein [Fictibacillus macauensis]
MEKERSSFKDFDENERIIAEQITQSYQSGVVDYVDQQAQDTKTEDEESLQ